MKVEELDYVLPKELIAQAPAIPRDSSRLLICRRNSDSFETALFKDLPGYLKSGDILVTNAARVMPARLFGYKYPTGAKIEVFLLEPVDSPDPLNAPRYKALLRRRRRLVAGDTVFFPESTLRVTVVGTHPEIGEDIVELTADGDIADEIENVGHVPLPPYIKNYEGDLERYQTVFSSVTGSVAAPTAGLHFTPELLDNLTNAGIRKAGAHLRVGWGTFSPIRAENIEDHRLHEETGALTGETASVLNDVRKSGGRIVAVGTTMTRLLETSVDGNGVFHPYSGSTGLYITPGFNFHAVDVLITNFHLPRTSLLALVCAFLGTEKTLKAYEFAVEEKFRFYSFGDAMLIL